MDVKKEKEVAIGIDLGLSSCCVAVWRHDLAEVIPNEMGNRTTPSYVAFTKTGCIVGEAAKNQVQINPANTIFDSTRLLGRKFDDEEVQRFIKLCPFKVVPSSEYGHEKKPIILVSYKGDIKEYQAESITAIILVKLKLVAETYLGTEVKNAVITVPACFNFLQREAIKGAGVIAGLNVMRVIDKPLAAAIAYCPDKNTSGGIENVLVFELGKETCAISLVHNGKDVFEVKSTSENGSLGGRDFDSNLVSYFVNEFKRKHGKNISGNPRAMDRLRVACERAKIAISSTPETIVAIENIIDGIDLVSSLSRARFNLLNSYLFVHCASLVENCLKEAKMGREDVHKIVLVGGASEIPMIRQRVQEIFGMELCHSIHPKEVFACGAAAHAAAILGMRSMDKTDISSLLNDVDYFLDGFGVSMPMESLPSHTKAKIGKMLSRLKLNYSDTKLVKNLSLMLRVVETSLPEHLRPALSAMERTIVCQHQYLETSAAKDAAVINPDLIKEELAISKKNLKASSYDCDKLKADIADINATIACLMEKKTSLEKDLNKAQLKLVDFTASIATQMESAKKRLNQVASFQNAEKSLGVAVDCLAGFLASL